MSEGFQRTAFRLLASSVCQGTFCRHLCKAALSFRNYAITFS